MNMAINTLNHRLSPCVGLDILCSFVMYFYKKRNHDHLCKDQPFKCLSYSMCLQLTLFQSKNPMKTQRKEQHEAEATMQLS